MKEEELGLCIPTYNRAKEIRELLACIVPQAQKYGYPIYISDQSTDGLTKKTVAEFSKAYSKVHYYSLETKGYTANVMNLIMKAETRHIWLLGDDDLLKPHALDEINKRLVAGFDFILVNSEVWDKDMKVLINSRLVRKEADDIYQKAGDGVLKTIAMSGYSGFMSALIVPRRRVIEEAKKIDLSAPDLDFIHIILFFRAISGKRGIFLANPLIKIRGNNGGYSKRIMDIYFPIWKKSHSMLTGYYSKNAINAMQSRDFIGNLHPIIINKLLNDSNPGRDYEKYVKNNDEFRGVQRCIVWTIMYSPRSLVRFWYVTYRFIKRRFPSAGL
jgi:glycosyltransferase involved in cell wall biosynthesis